ncbi:MAG TPA: RNA 2',3'-cyclic phosphodiesterase, partial [Alphaproteobacteria bacterium]|nr:RNA 2',3'-cyclic phosphodiesterase [Alphaproteobacteria bacterium]
PEPRRFRPHVTLGRVRGRLPADAAATDALDGMRLTLDVVVLFRSELRPEGARHTALARFPLAAPR